MISDNKVEACLADTNGSFAEELEIDAEHIALHGGDPVAIAKTMMQAAQYIRALESEVQRLRERWDCVLEVSGRSDELSKRAFCK